MLSREDGGGRDIGASDGDRRDGEDLDDSAATQQGDAAPKTIALSALLIRESENRRRKDGP